MFRIFLLFSLFFFIAPLFAHFQMLIPADDIVGSGEARRIKLNTMFWHPYEGFGMNMEKPRKCGVYTRDRHHNLLPQLKAEKFKDRRGNLFQGFTLEYTLNSPGDHLFYVEPKPYWEQSEGSFIVHYTKVIINAFGLQSGWDRELGLKTEIVPLTRPYGIYTGNVFQGIVKLNGKPVPFSEVEVEYYNEDGKSKAPADPYITQLIKTDSRGVFTYAMPRAGWWGFAALNSDGKKMPYKGKNYPVELGAILWIRTRDMK